MGKKSKKGGAPAEAAPAGTAGDDELLELAAAANKAAAEAALAEAKRKELAEATGAGTEPRRPKLDELQDYLDKINFFDIRSVEHSDGREPVLSPSGEYIFYADMNDAAQALEERKLTQCAACPHRRATSRRRRRSSRPPRRRARAALAPWRWDAHRWAAPSG